MHLSQISAYLLQDVHLHMHLSLYPYIPMSLCRYEHLPPLAIRDQTLTPLPSHLLTPPFPFPLYSRLDNLRVNRVVSPRGGPRLSRRHNPRDSPRRSRSLV